MRKKKLSNIMAEYLDRDRKTYARGRKYADAHFSFLDEIVAYSMGDEVPVQVDEPEWTVSSDPERLFRVFTFDGIVTRNNFINEILEYEKMYGHYGTLLIKGLEVSVEVYTHDLNSVTELDKDYAQQCDDIFTEVVRWGDG